MEVRCEGAVYVKAKLSRATLHLTRLDQSRNRYYCSILFYQGQAHVEEQGAAPVQAVRRGVEAMVEHYPWAAGRLHVVKQLRTCSDGEEEEQEVLEIYINEDGGPGVQLVEARVNRPLCSFGDPSDPNPAFEPLYATVDEKAPYHSQPLVALQVTRFECGGFCVSMASNHAIFDGLGASMFLQNMGSCAREKGLCLPLDLAPRDHRIYPRNPPSPKLPCSMRLVHKKDVERSREHTSFSISLPATKFVFTQRDLTELRSHALANQEDCKRGFQACSRFQVLTAHLWKAKAKCMLALHGDVSEEFSLHVAVNARERVMASIPKNYVGNAYGVARPSASLGELNEKSLAFAVEIIQDAIKQVSSESFQSDLDHFEIQGTNVCIVLPSMVVPYLANLGFYDVDFGWGKPIYFGRHFKQARNRVIVMDGNAHGTSLNVLAAFISEEERLVFQGALEWKSNH